MKKIAVTVVVVMMAVLIAGCSSQEEPEATLVKAGSSSFELSSDFKEGGSLDDGTIYYEADDGTQLTAEELDGSIETTEFIEYISFSDEHKSDPQEMDIKDASLGYYFYDEDNTALVYILTKSNTVVYVAIVPGTEHKAKDIVDMISDTYKEED